MVVIIVSHISSHFSFLPSSVSLCSYCCCFPFFSLLPPFVFFIFFLHLHLPHLLSFFSSSSSSPSSFHLSSSSSFGRRYIKKNDPSMERDGDFRANAINTGAFLIWVVMEVNIFGANHIGHPFMESLFENKLLWRSLVFVWGMALVRSVNRLYIYVNRFVWWAGLRVGGGAGACQVCYNTYSCVHAGLNASLVLGRVCAFPPP